MSRDPVSGFLAELRRRRVMRVAVVYLAAAFAMIQAADGRESRLRVTALRRK